MNERARRRGNEKVEVRIAIILMKRGSNLGLKGLHLVMFRKEGNLLYKPMVNTLYWSINSIAERHFYCFTTSSDLEARERPDHSMANLYQFTIAAFL